MKTRAQVAFVMFVTLLMLQGLCQGVVPGGRLTDEEVNATIRRGNHDSRSHQIGLRLVDQQEFFLSGITLHNVSDVRLRHYCLYARTMDRAGSTLCPS